MTAGSRVLIWLRENWTRFLIKELAWSRFKPKPKPEPLLHLMSHNPTNVWFWFKTKSKSTSYFQSQNHQVSTINCRFLLLNHTRVSHQQSISPFLQWEHLNSALKPDLIEVWENSKSSTWSKPNGSDPASFGQRITAQEIWWKTAFHLLACKFSEKKPSWVESVLYP